MTREQQHEKFEERCPACGDRVEPELVQGELVAVTCPNCGHSHGFSKALASPPSSRRRPLQPVRKTPKTILGRAKKPA